ncbi:hypothetical protein CPT_Privateer_063 [Proteus phage Privateer]|uniref:Uncharacterized protein n=1 Tax=Proteus phage Privateer TaxID=2712958 RepID=A0A6G8R3W4_9CAUD|nr:hypothetical protein HWD17_gp063 [Proteus phage Privateer]QIN94856.1 hypothetical protein CPT_Privateer_063 [Proteus phage Privateer]
MMYNRKLSLQEQELLRSIFDMIFENHNRSIKVLDRFRNVKVLYPEVKDVLNIILFFEDREIKLQSLEFYIKRVNNQSIRNIIQSSISNKRYKLCLKST